MHLSKFVVVAVAFVLALVEAKRKNEQCIDGVCLMCDLYMAPSTIPNSGWGVFTGRKRKEDEPIDPFDVAIQVADYDYQMQFEDAKGLPEWLLKEYHWMPEITQAVWDADHIYSIIPGLGMLANSHTGMYNLMNDGPQTRERVPRSLPEMGAFTHYQEQCFSPVRDLEAGDELFVEYGDDWFESREEEMGTIPLEADYERADAILEKWQALNLSPEVARDVWDNLVTGAVYPLMQPRLRAALPLSAEDAMEALTTPGMTAAASFLPDRPNRSIEWLQQNGLCLDHIDTETSDLLPNQFGAVAKRDIPKGHMVAPAPLVHLSRRHLEILSADADKNIFWKGKQLLLNYCYGHKDSSILLFPYSPGVNLINHATAPEKQPNVALRWSDRMTQPELLKLSAEELLKHNNKAGLLMEIYALRDLEAGEELLLDYGADWQQAYEKHVAEWVPPVHADDYQSPWDFELNEEIYTLDEPNEYPGSTIQVRCWIDVNKVTGPDDEGWFSWVTSDSEYIDATCECIIKSADYDNEGRKGSYRVIAIDEDDGSKVKVKDVPWSAITFVEKEYVGHQFQRQAFRHEIRLPDEVFPDAWKDLKPADLEGCGFYMAESAIPNAGLGVYTGKVIPNAQKIYSGDVVIHVEDYEGNNELRAQFMKEEDDGELWLLDHYYWEPTISKGHYLADTVISIIPGLGMLANSHPGLVNCELESPTNTRELHRSKDPGAGATTTYHDVHFVATQEIGEAEEVFVRYGDAWFEHREDLGMIPLSNDFVRADALVSRFWYLTHGEFSSEVAEDAWKLIARLTDERSRVASALPKNFSDIETVMETGTAKASTPNRIRSIEWLEENGRCLDNIRPDKSTIHQAGKGAFATRKIGKGAVVTPVPVVQILRRHLEIYERENYDDEDSPVRFLHMQLLLNYCYSHRNSSIMLFPYSPVSNYIDHNQTLANAELRWSSLPNHRKEWLERAPEELARLHSAGLILEVVATRDIAPGEEIFLDYGDDFEKAWREHLIDWYAPKGAEDYISAATLNDKIEWLRTAEELKVDPYPSNVFTVCFLGTGRFRDTNSTEVVYKWAGDVNDVDNAFPCDVVERDASVDLQHAFDRKDSIEPLDVRYTVIVHEDDEGDRTFTGVPRTAIQFFDEPYTADQFLRSSFRHEIHLPDSMVPDAWRDLA